MQHSNINCHLNRKMDNLKSTTTKTNFPERLQTLFYLMEKKFNPIDFICYKRQE